MANKILEGILVSAHRKEKKQPKSTLEEAISDLKERVSKLEKHFLIEDKPEIGATPAARTKKLEISYEVHAAFDIGIQIRVMILEFLGLAKFVKSDSKPENISIYLVEYYRTNNPEHYKEIEAMIKEEVFNVVPKGVRYYVNDKYMIVT